MSALSFIIPAAAGLVGSILGSTSQSKANKSNLELAKYQFDKDVEMWNMQNAYNTPVQQMARLREAKLNPHLVYGSGAVGNVTSAPPKFNSPVMKPYTGYANDFSSAAMNAFNAQNLYEQNKNLKTQNEVLESSADLNKSRAEGQNIENKVKGGTAETEIDIKSEELKQKRLDVEKGRKDLKRLDAEIVLRETEKDLKEAQIDLTTHERSRLQLIIKMLLAELPAKVKESELYLQYGVTKSDTLLWRAVSSIAKALGISLESASDVVFPDID